MTTSDTQSVVEIRSVSFGYPNNSAGDLVLENVNLDIMADDFLGIVGPNGGGKTTLLKVILGLLRPSKGTVTVFGQSPERSRNRIGYVPQYAQIDHSVPADVLDVVLMGRLGQSLWGPRYRSSDVDKARHALSLTSTDDLARRPIGTLSGGQRQRVLIARALASDAKILLLDEPTSGVDAHMERGLIELLQQLNETLPIVMISHDISFVSSRLKRVACLNRSLTCHAASEISDGVVAAMYHGHVHAVHHGDHCSHSE
ncbi:MAG: metal ABC transporter ATP-binding protein [Planctomycetota bacterium]|jgi:zinc transport system ATP-binding protein